jgi:hypothetical protein
MLLHLRTKSFPTYWGKKIARAVILTEKDAHGGMSSRSSNSNLQNKIPLYLSPQFRLGESSRLSKSESATQLLPASTCCFLRKTSIVRCGMGWSIGKTIQIPFHIVGSSALSSSQRRDWGDLFSACSSN